ncbi:MAG: hypothetical protein KGL39_56400 [Patescibacteria group bacterium]|nr:hypothetical protein [Patescibacteria group bacterium]
MLWLTERQDRALVEEARQRGIPASEIVRQFLTERYELEPETIKIGRPYRSPAMEEGQEE